MSIVEQLERENKIEEHDIDTMSKLLFQSFSVKKNYRKPSTLSKKEDLIVSYTDFLKKYLEGQFLTSKKDKLTLINLIDKMNMQKELLELQRKEIKMNDIINAGKTLGAKSQSSFSTK